jgi:hypothetical protein
MDPQELIEAVRSIYPEYEWPPEYRLDLSALILSIEEGAEKFPVSFENGYEQNMLVFPFACAWGYTLRDAIFAGDEEAIATSIERLREGIAAHPDKITLQEFLADAVDRAELGDPAPLQMMIDGMGCATMRWEAGTPEAAALDPRSLPRREVDTAGVDATHALPLPRVDAAFGVHATHALPLRGAGT